MDRIAALSISLLVALAVYAFDQGLGSDPEPTRSEAEFDEPVESDGGGTIMFSTATTAGRASGGGGGIARERSLGRPPTCVTPLRGCGFVLKKDTPTRVARNKGKGGGGGGGGFFGFGGSDDD